MENIISIIILMAFSFLIRLPFVLGESSDEWVTWWRIKQQKGKGSKYEFPDSLREGYSGYPRLQFSIISRFPQRLWGPIGNFLNITYDCIAVLIVYIFAKIIFAYLGIVQYRWVIEPAMWVALISSTTPILLPVTGRLKGIKARTLGGLLSLLYFITFGFAYIGGNPYLYIATIIIGILATLSSVFALQNIAFLSLCLTFLYFDWVPLAAFLVSQIVGLAIPFLSTNKYYPHRINHYRWLIKNYKQFPLMDRRNRLIDFVLLPKYLIKQPDLFLSQVFRNNSLIIAIYSVPAIFILAFLVIFKLNFLYPLLANDITQYLGFLVLGSIIIFTLSSFKPFLFLGQAERYFEYSAGFLSILLVLSINIAGLPTDLLFWILMLQICMILVIFCYTMRAEINKAFRSAPSSNNTELINFLNGLDEELRILTIPIKYSPALSYQLQNPKARFYYMFVSQKKSGFEYMEEDLIQYNWPRRDLLYFKNKYSVNLIVALKSNLVKAEKMGINYEINQYQCIYQDSEYAIYRI